MKSEPTCPVGEPRPTAPERVAGVTGNIHRELNSGSPPECHCIRILDPDDAAEWDRRVFAHADYNFFHSAAWARVLCETYGHKAHYLLFSGPSGEVAALAPLMEVLSPLTGRRAVCLPFSDFCPPLVFSGNQRTLIETEILRLAAERRWKYVELRGADSLEITSEGPVTYYGHKLDLTDPVEAVFDRFANGTKGAVRQALKSELEVETVHSDESVREFFKLHSRTRRRHGVPPQPSRFFESIHRNVIKRGLGFVVLARAGVRAVAGAIFCSFGDRAIYKFAASNIAYAHTRANNLVLWHAIKHLVDSGVKMLDLGRTDLTNEGLRRFKLSWGAKEDRIRYARLQSDTGRWSLSAGDRPHNPYSRLSRHLPIRLNNFIGEMVYPHLD